jgi:hypothetical protein
MSTRTRADDPEGMISASLVIVIVVATVVGALVGLLLGSATVDSRLTAIVAGFIATIVASIARYTILIRRAHGVVDGARIPAMLVANAAIASIAGSLAAHDLAELVRPHPSPFLLGALAGLLSAILTALLMIVYHNNPNPGR